MTQTIEDDLPEHVDQSDYKIKWEYLRIPVSDVPIDYAVHPDPVNRQLDVVLDNMGESGWELVGIHAMPDVVEPSNETAVRRFPEIYQLIHTFKRPKRKD
ncbi:hypothetical protein OAM79_05625 [Litorivicinus sp.]|nr:hypothetical protein [Litorivicinus sp.]